jgi:hypothetical protein
VNGRAPHPVACRDPILPRQGPAVRFKLSFRSWLTPRLPETCARCLQKDASLRLLQPTSPHEHPADCSIPGCVSLHVTPRGALTPRCAKYRTRRLALGHGPGGDEVGCPDAACQTSQPGGASLDGEPPASASAATRSLISRSAFRPGLSRSGTPDPAQSWRGCDRQPLCAKSPDPGVFSRGPSMRRSL